MLLAPYASRLGALRMVLASQSPRRREILAQCGLDFEVVPSLFDERSLNKAEFATPVRQVPQTALLWHIQGLSRGWLAMRRDAAAQFPAHGHHGRRAAQADFVVENARQKALETAGRLWSEPGTTNQLLVVGACHARSRGARTRHTRCCARWSRGNTRCTRAWRWCSCGRTGPQTHGRSARRRRS